MKAHPWSSPPERPAPIEVELWYHPEDDADRLRFLTILGGTGATIVEVTEQPE